MWDTPFSSAPGIQKHQLVLATGHSNLCPPPHSSSEPVDVTCLCPWESRLYGRPEAPTTPVIPPPHNNMLIKTSNTTLAPEMSPENPPERTDKEVCLLQKDKLGLATRGVSGRGRWRGSHPYKGKTGRPNQHQSWTNTAP